MIPRHRPPFGVGDMLAVLLASSENISVERLEAAYAAAFGLPYAILLPSARAGICWTLRAAVNSDSTIIGPAYTCAVVHEAMTRSGARLCLIDTQVDSFLMDPTRLAAARSGNYAIVLSEIYGYPYDPHILNGQGKSSPHVKIFDSAMTVPVPQIFERLQGNDFVVISFGLGKCIYAGWGGIGMTKDDALARDVRAQRDAFLHKSNLLLLLRRGAEILFRTVAHARVLYGACQKFRGPPLVYQLFPPTWNGNMSLSKEWYLPSTAVDRCLVLHNLKQSTRFYEHRRALAHRYHENLAGVPSMITLPPSSPYAMSHYTIRVPPPSRDTIQVALSQSGIDTGTLFRFAGYFLETEFPNAARISSEVLNLPLHEYLTIGDVDYICDSVIRCISQPFISPYKELH